LILTVTLNAALDVTYRLGEVHWDQVNRVEQVSTRAGGKGVNVARVLHALGVDSTVTGLVGGATGDAIRADLAAAGLNDQMVGIAGESRRTVVIVHPRGATVFNEPGAHVSASEWAAFVDRFGELLAGCAAVVLSGSVPPGIPREAYAVLLRMATDAGVQGVLDAQGEALMAGLAGRPAIVKPNQLELGAAVGRPCGSMEDLLAAAGLLRSGGAGAVVVTRGADGLVASTPDGNWTAAAPESVAGNATGAGDAVAAALAVGLLRAQPWPERLVEAVAMGAAAVVGSLAGDIDLASYRGFRAAVHLRRL
jgi:tagatose 6-phosphate kinase